MIKSRDFPGPALVGRWISVTWPGPIDYRAFIILTLADGPDTAQRRLRGSRAGLRTRLAEVGTRLPLRKGTRVLRRTSTLPAAASLCARAWTARFAGGGAELCAHPLGVHDQHGIGQTRPMGEDKQATSADCRCLHVRSPT